MFEAVVFPETPAYPTTPLIPSTKLLWKRFLKSHSGWKCVSEISICFRPCLRGGPLGISFVLSGFGGFQSLIEVGSLSFFSAFQARFWPLREATVDFDTFWGRKLREPSRVRFCPDLLPSQSCTQPECENFEPSSLKSLAMLRSVFAMQN